MSSIGNRRSARTPSSASASGSSPLVAAALVASAVGLALWTLVSRGRIAWPPTQLLAGIATVAGCLAVVGPILLATRAGKSGGGLGELLWMTGGVLIWAFDLAAVVRGDWRGLSWAAPLSSQAMGLTILAVGAAAWRWRSPAGGRDWSWTNVTGWLLGLFWIGMGLATLAPDARLLAMGG